MQRSTKLLRALSIAVALTMASEAHAQSWIASLNGANEVPVNASPGIGTVSFSLAGNVLSINGSFSGLLGTTSAAHAHCCTVAPFAGTAGVATTTPSLVGFPLGVMSGAFSTTLDLTLPTSFNPAFVTANGNNISLAQTTLINGFNSGQAYFNVHTSVFGGGEIRGFLVSTVPEPSTYALMMLGFAGIMFMTRKRSRQRE